MLIYLSMLPEEEDRERLAAFYEAYRELMYRTAHRVLGHHQDAEDAVHQVFLRLVRHTDRLAALKGEGARQFAVTVAVHAALDVQRGKNGRREIPLEEDLFVEPAPEEDGRLSDWILRLPEVQRSVVLLHCAHGFNMAETADLLGLTVDAAYKHLQRAKTKLRKYAKGGVTA